MTAAKAWKVEDGDDDDRSCIVHARDRSEAKMFAQGELDADEFISLRAVRAPEFDGLSGDDLIREQLAQGWWFGCMGPRCQKEVRSEREESGYEEGYMAAPYVLRNGEVYCSAACCLARLRRERDERIAIWAAVEWVVARWPGIEIQSVWLSSGHGVQMQFLFPGGTYPAGWGADEPEMVRTTDADGNCDAWDAFSAPLRAARGES